MITRLEQVVKASEYLPRLGHVENTYPQGHGETFKWEGKKVLVLGVKYCM